MDVSPDPLYVDKKGDTAKFKVSGGTGGYVVKTNGGFAEVDEETGSGTYTSPNREGEYTLIVTDSSGQTKEFDAIVGPMPPETINIVKESVPSLGQAIIIAAGGAEDSNTLYPYTKDHTQRFYRLLKERGFSDDSIYYISQQAPDINNDGYLERDKHDYNLFEPEQDLADAFNQAAGKLNAEQQFVFYLHGHARADNILIKKDYELSATKLRDLLATLPAGSEQIIIIDTCYSGSFIDDIKGVANRVVITSADDSSLAWQVEHKSFSDKFLRILHSGEDLGGAFQNTEEYIMENEDFFGNQRPWLDDNGDGEYTSLDGRLAAQIYLGKKAVHAAPPPTIQVHPLIVLDPNTTEANLWVHTTPGSDGIRKVRAILINPEFSRGEYQGIETNFGREQLELIYNPVRQRYGIIYQGFKTSGMWRILYQAQNKEGIWSDIVQGEVQSQGSFKIASIKMQLNQSSYQITEPLHLNLQLDGQTEADLYVAIIFPDNNFRTISYPSSNQSWPNEVKIYQAKVKIAGQHNYTENIKIPSDAELGQYSACGLLVNPETAPLDMANWIDFHCAEFEVY